MPENTGGVTMPIFHAIPNADGSITHFDHRFDPQLYKTLSHLYVVCVADNSGPQRQITAVFFAKTSHHHDDPGFGEAMEGAMHLIPNLAAHFKDKLSLLPARLGVAPDDVLSEREMLKITMAQLLKFGASGSA